MFARVVNMPLKLGDEGLEISWPIPLRGTILEECPQLHARAVPIENVRRVYKNMIFVHLHTLL